MARDFDTHRYRKLKAALRRERRQPCWLCDQRIDYSLPSEHPESFSADHIQTVRSAPQLALVYTNLAPSHLHCNKERGERLPTPPLGDISGMW